jgi:polysaccharide deacetylase 2 family uncharacterized protein YibQ
MARKSRRKRRRRSVERSLTLAWRAGIVLAVILAVGTVLTWRWSQAPSGRLFLADRGLDSATEWAAARFQLAIRGALTSTGIAGDRIEVEPAVDDAPAVIRLATDHSLLDLNVAVTAAVESAGGTVHRGSLREEDEGERLELHVGTARRLTHRILVRRGRTVPDITPIPRGRLALVIDDLGHNFNGLTRRVLSLDAPVTLAILPELRHSVRVLNEAQRAGKQTLLHMPMEPDPGAPVGPGEPSIQVGMELSDIQAAVEDCLDGLPGVEGLNNHTGSYATRHRAEMEAVMEVLAGRGMVFFDSQTTPKSVAHVAAAEAGVPVLRNDIFIDRETEDVAVVEERIERLLRIARKRGWAVGIGHVNAATVEALERLLPRLRPGDVELVFLADLIREVADG